MHGQAELAGHVADLTALDAGFGRARRGRVFLAGGKGRRSTGLARQRGLARGHAEHDAARVILYACIETPHLAEIELKAGPAFLALAHAHGLQKAAAHRDALAHVTDHGGILQIQIQPGRSAFLGLDQTRGIARGAAHFQNDFHAVFVQGIPGKHLHFRRLRLGRGL